MQMTWLRGGETDPIGILPDKDIFDAGPVSRRFQAEGMRTFLAACRHVHQMPYGYNRSKEEPLILFTSG